MKLLSIVVIVVVVEVFEIGALHKNPFDVVRGCKQYDNVGSYDASLTYFPTTSLLHVGQTQNSKYFKLAVLGSNDGIIRFGESLYPYDKYVIEIVLGGWTNTKSAGRQQYRNASNANNNNQLVQVQTPNLLSQFQPTMFVLEVFNNGTVQVSIDGQDHPFLSFNDSQRIPVNYMTFTKWDKDLVLFYDCPLKDVNAFYNSLLLNCTVV
uniref:Methyltransf_FA domain-containing protein n=1 Tax=Anopheles funestus TaxID=62324 RepID=A0A4Y0BR30_ANOFN